LKISRVISKCLLLMCLLILVLRLPDAGAAATQNFHVLPNGLDIGESFQGAEIEVSAEVPAGSNAVVEFRGDVHEDRLLRKGRRGGLWMNVGEVTVRNAPSLYLVMSTDASLISNPGAENQWGYGALQRQMEFSGAIPKAGKDKLFQEFLKLKESHGLYGTFPGSLKVVGASTDHAKLEGKFWLPDKIPPANYKVHFFVLNNGKVVDEKTSAFPVEMRGMPAVLTALAFDHATVYGLLAVTIAILAGFLMAFVFKGKGAH
jgi:hypothetical protein